MRAPDGVSTRPATRDDAATIAAIHAASWRAHYRGSLSDAYLDGPVEAERAAVWAERLGHPRAGQLVLVAEAGREIVGFVCAFLDHDRRFGTLVDNLHVVAERKRIGIGRVLTAAAGNVLLNSLPRRPVHLTVLEANHAARAFYDRIGGEVVERGRHTEPDGSDVAVLRYVWASPAALIEGAAP